MRLTCKLTSYHYFQREKAIVLSYGVSVNVTGHLLKILSTHICLRIIYKCILIGSGVWSVQRTAILFRPYTGLICQVTTTMPWCWQCSQRVCLRLQKNREDTSAAVSILEDTHNCYCSDICFLLDLFLVQVSVMNNSDRYFVVCSHPHWVRMLERQKRYLVILRRSVLPTQPAYHRYQNNDSQHCYLYTI